MLNLPEGGLVFFNCKLSKGDQYGRHWLLRSNIAHGGTNFAEGGSINRRGLTTLSLPNAIARGAVTKVTLAALFRLNEAFGSPKFGLGT